MKIAIANAIQAERATEKVHRPNQSEYSAASRDSGDYSTGEILKVYRPTNPSATARDSSD